jgi:hypothetical protein
MSTQLKNWFCNLGFWRWNHFYWPRDIPYLSKYRGLYSHVNKNSKRETRDPIEKLVTIYKHRLYLQPHTSLYNALGHKSHWRAFI